MLQDAKPNKLIAGRRTLGLVLTLAALVLLSGCLTAGLATPYPDVVQVDHPHQPQPEQDPQALFEAYTTSPNRNPDGQGVLPVFWPQSQATLVTESLARNWERGNQIAFARTESAQRTAEDQSGSYHRKHVVILTALFADHPPQADPTWFQPEGVYLLDDKGRRFAPLEVKPDQAEVIYHYTILARHRTQYSGIGAPAVRFSRIIFPGDAVTAETRALFLYFAAYQRRLRFAWVFDPDYSIPLSSGGDFGQGLERVLR